MYLRDEQDQILKFVCSYSDDEQRRDASQRKCIFLIFKSIFFSNNSYTVRNYTSGTGWSDSWDKPRLPKKVWETCSLAFILNQEFLVLRKRTEKYFLVNPSVCPPPPRGERCVAYPWWGEGGGMDESWIKLSPPPPPRFTTSPHPLEMIPLSCSKPKMMNFLCGPMMAI